MAKGSGSGMQAGMTTKQPSVDDASRKPKGGSVNDGATRDKPSEQQATVGPRTA